MGGGDLVAPAARKLSFVARLKFPTYETKPFIAELTMGQAEEIAKMLEKYKKAGAIQDYYLGKPDRMEQLHALILSGEILKIELPGPDRAREEAFS
jgi:hypothetical protein